MSPYMVLISGTCIKSNTWWCSLFQLKGLFSNIQSAVRTEQLPHRPGAECMCLISYFRDSFQSDMVSENEPLLLWVCSSLFRMNWLVSINRSTQLTKHISVLESIFGPGLSIHFSWRQKQNNLGEMQQIIQVEHHIEHRNLRGDNKWLISITEVCENLLLFPSENAFSSQSCLFFLTFCLFWSHNFYFISQFWHLIYLLFKSHSSKLWDIVKIVRYKVKILRWKVTIAR